MTYPTIAGILGPPRCIFFADFSVHQTLQDLEVIREIHITKEVLHVNMRRHIFTLLFVVTVNVTFMICVFIGQCVSVVDYKGEMSFIYMTVHL